MSQSPEPDLGEAKNNEMNESYVQNLKTENKSNLLSQNVVGASSCGCGQTGGPVIMRQ